MDEDHLHDLLKAHYASSGLTEGSVQKILENCQVARDAHRWRQRTLGAMALATVALVALALSLLVDHPEAATGEEFVETPAEEADDFGQKLIAVMIHANDCPKSKAMVPVFAGLQEEFLEEPVLFIKFDYSSKCARHQAELLSKNLGLEEIFQRHRETGAIVLVSPRGVIKDVVAPQASVAAAAAVVRDNLNFATF